MSWQPLRLFRDRSVPKLNNLRRAADGGLRVPPTWWLPAAQIPAAGLQQRIAPDLMLIGGAQSSLAALRVV